MRTIILISLCLLTYSLKAQTLLFIPDTLSGSSIQLTMHPDSVAFFPGIKSATYGYNQYPYLGPTLIFNKGTQQSISVVNGINDTTTVHWHGIHIPSKWDGGPHTALLPGETWNPQFTVMDQAATYWYHPHLHMKTAKQAIKGAAGMIIVRDSLEATLSLPRTYGVDDFPLILQSQQYDSLNQAMPLGMEDSTLMVNGARANNGFSVFGEFPAQMVRLRMLNASGERLFNLGFSGNTSFHQIASDGGLLTQSFDTTRIRLAPGERAEIVVDLSGLEGQTLSLMSYASELPMGVQGGPTMPMPAGSPPMDSPLNGIDFNLMTIHVLPMTANALTAIPTQLNPNAVPYATSTANYTREIRFTADSLMVMDGPFYFNDSSFNMDRIDFVIPVGQTEIWKLVNETMVGHPFHIHDVQFYLFDRNGYTPSESDKGRKDVVFLQTGDSVYFITKFEDFADSVIPFMYHCHILMHEDAGMMGQFLVVPPEFVGMNPAYKVVTPFHVFPNPTAALIQWKLPITETPCAIRILNERGEVVERHEAFVGDQLVVSSLAVGNYRLLIQSGEFYYSSSFIKH
jgi:blue copper oxidase